MQVDSTIYTIAQYCDDFISGRILVNPNYQRSPDVWPAAARSYLIDTVLNGFPIPKLTLYPATDLRTRRTTYEIVDGQQRTQAIVGFFQDEYAISTTQSVTLATRSKARRSAENATTIRTANSRARSPG